MTIVSGKYEHEGKQFDITRTSSDSVTVALNCGDHDHEDYIVGRIEGDGGWGVGRKDSGYPHEGDSFLEAVEHCATMISEECASLDAIEQVDGFFESDVMPALEDRLNTLAGFLPRFESPDFDFGHMIARPGEMPFYRFSEDASEFVRVCYRMKWVHPLDWGQWKGSDEAVRLRDDPAAMEGATAEQLQKLLTVVIRQERFVDGALASAFESGLLVRILRRAAVLSQGLEVAVADGPDSATSNCCDSSQGDGPRLPEE